MLILFLAACESEPVVHWCTDELASAGLIDVQLYRASLLGGAIKGRGWLAGLGVDGTECEALVSIDGGEVGLGVELVQLQFTTELELPWSGVSGADVFGRYTGTVASSVPVAGVATAHMINRHGVEIDAPFLGLGLGFNVAHSWFELSIYDGEVYDDDTGDSGEDGE